ncbi:MAG: citrate/2-methylcitrate synthase [Pseudomonadota bacterium]
MQVAKGLEGVVVAQSSICDVQAQGILTYRGVPIETLVDKPFLEVAQHVITGSTDADWQGRFDDTKHLSDATYSILKRLPPGMHPMKMLQTMVPVIAQASNQSEPLELGFHIAAQLPETVLSYLQGRRILLDDQLGDYASQITQALGHDPTGEHFAALSAALNTAQILQVEHSLNAGTFAARVVASTLADIDSAIVAGFGALSGELHGGADQDAIEMADRLDDVANAQAFVADMLASNIKVPGMGHREYRVRDPRAACLDRWAQTLARGDLRDTYEKLQAIETEFRAVMQAKGKPLHTNVDFYKGVVYRALGLPDYAFTAAFAMARVFGYIAHYIENAQDNRIFRPQAQYVA